MAYRQVEVSEQSQTSDTPGESLVGRRIHARRLELGLTQAEVAAGMLSPSYLSLVESGRRQPAPAALAHIAERLGVDPGYLLDGIDAEVRRRARLALGHAEVALHRGDIADAYTRFAALEDDPGLGDEQHRRVRLGRAIAAERKGDLEEALRLLGELAEEARREPNVHPWMDVAEALSRCYHEAGDLDMAIHTGEEAMQSAAELGLEGGDEYVRLGCTVLMGYYERGDLARATVLAADLIRGAESSGAPHSRGAAYWNAALLAESRGQIGEALSLVDRALALFGESDDRRNLARLRVCYAWLLLQQQPPEAEQALDLLDRVADEIQVHGGAIDLGYYATERARALLALGRLDEARAAALDSLDRLGDQPRIESARARLLLGRILREQGKSDETLEQCTVAANMLEEMGASRQAAAAWRELGDLYRDLGRIDETLDAYDRALVAVRVSPVAGVGPSAGALELPVS
ncbi:MAG TPA: helix-turn-helix domain-containing protein [Jiangellaceae bacterium]